MMSEYRRKRRNRIYKEHKKKIRDVMSRRERENSYLVSILVDESHKDQGKEKGNSSLLPPQNPTVNLTATYIYKHFQWIPLMMKNVI